MMTTPDEVTAALAGTFLAGLPICHGDGGTILVLDIPRDKVLDAWQTARVRVPVTGRWPVMVSDDWPWDWQGEPSAEDLAEFDEATQNTDPWPEFTAYNDELTDVGLVSVIARGHGFDLTAEAVRQFGLPTTSSAVEPWVYQRVLSDPDLLRQVENDARYELNTEHWYAPDRVMLMLPPSDLPWMAPYWVQLYMTTSEGLGAALRQWYERWGAQLVASWGTMLQLVVDRPPTSRDEAWTVAGQILGMASHLELNQWELAIALPPEHGMVHPQPAIDSESGREPTEPATASGSAAVRALGLLVGCQRCSDCVGSPPYRAAKTRSRRISYCWRHRRGGPGGRCCTSPPTTNSCGWNCSAVRSTSHPSDNRFQ